MLVPDMADVACGVVELHLVLARLGLVVVARVVRGENQRVVPGDRAAAARQSYCGEGEGERG